MSHIFATTLSCCRLAFLLPSEFTRLLVPFASLTMVNHLACRCMLIFICFAASALADVATMLRTASMAHFLNTTTPLSATTSKAPSPSIIVQDSHPSPTRTGSHHASTTSNRLSFDASPLTAMNDHATLSPQLAYVNNHVIGIYACTCDISGNCTTQIYEQGSADLKICVHRIGEEGGCDVFADLVQVSFLKLEQQRCDTSNSSDTGPGVFRAVIIQNGVAIIDNANTSCSPGVCLAQTPVHNRFFSSNSSSYLVASGTVVLETMLPSSYDRPDGRGLALRRPRSRLLQARAGTSELNFSVAVNLQHQNKGEYNDKNKTSVPGGNNTLSNHNDTTGANNDKSSGTSSNSDFPGKLTPLPPGYWALVFGFIFLTVGCTCFIRRRLQSKVALDETDTAQR